MMTGSNFDRPPPGVSVYDHLLVLHQNGFKIATQNIFNAGIEIVRGIIGGWDHGFGKGIKPKNYVGDIFASFGGEPDFGPGARSAWRGIRKRMGRMAVIQGPTAAREQ